MTHKKLRIILGDQLNHQHSWLSKVDDDVLYVLMEVRQETDYVKHHVQKVVAFFLAMRAFADYLQKEGHQVKYFKLDDDDNEQNITKNLKALVKKHSIEKVEYQLPDEYRLDQQMQKLESELGVEVEGFDTEHFYTERLEMEEFFEGKKTYLMENFYRHMRKKHGVMIEGNDQPAGGQWNYDKNNRKKIPRNHVIDSPKLFERDVTELAELLEEAGVETIGKLDKGQFIWPITREEGLEMLDHFVSERLVHFGDFQDALDTRYWSAYHSRLSFLMNVKLLSPKEVVDTVVARWEDDRTNINISQVEGFVRQVLGWREYMRGIYWAKMPEYATKNYFDHQKELPDYFWTGETKMNCMKQAIGQSLDFAYAHHIQRLMVTGNFALLAGISPDELDEWYLGIYIDAIEWVEITNTRGMSQFADGGIVGSKPYVSSANYINKMGNYCSDCNYSKTKKYGEGACPFNSLYWHFYERNRDKLGNNPRIGMMYRVLDKIDGEERGKILDQAEHYLENIQTL